MDYREAVNRARQWYNVCHNTNPARLEPEDVLALEYLQAKLPTPTIIGQLLENDTIIANITDLKLSAGGNGCHGCYWDIDEHKQQGYVYPCLLCTNYVYYENSQT